MSHDREQLTALVSFVESLPRPEQVLPDDAVALGLQLAQKTQSMGAPGAAIASRPVPVITNALPSFAIRAPSAPMARADFARWRTAFDGFLA